MLTQMHKVGMWVCTHTDVYVSAICNGEKWETTKIFIRRRMVTVYLLEEWNSHICSNMKISARHSGQDIKACKRNWYFIIPFEI